MRTGSHAGAAPDRGTDTAASLPNRGSAADRGTDTGADPDSRTY